MHEENTLYSRLLHNIAFMQFIASWLNALPKTDLSFFLYFPPLNGLAFGKKGKIGVLYRKGSFWSVMGAELCIEHI